MRALSVKCFAFATSPKGRGKNRCTNIQRWALGSPFGRAVTKWLRGKINNIRPLILPLGELSRSDWEGRNGSLVQRELSTKLTGGYNWPAVVSLHRLTTVPLPLGKGGMRAIIARPYGRLTENHPVGACIVSLQKAPDSSGAFVESCNFIWYSLIAVIPPTEWKEVNPLEVITSFIISVIAGIVAHYILKWLDGDK